MRLYQFFHQFFITLNLLWAFVLQGEIMVLQVSNLLNRIVFVHYNFCFAADYSLGVNGAVKHSAFVLTAFPTYVEVKLLSELEKVIPKLSDGFP